jgi:DNA polymerase-3 subunit gamma/tau
MSYEVLARKWRPQTFEEVIGQEHVTETLINAIKTGRVAHAYLFSGPRGVGKTSVARILAKAINCEKGKPGIPCNKCSSCVEVTNGSSVDVQEIDGASNRGIDEIRELRENVKYMPSSSKYRIYIIDEVHMLTLPAFNALLKTLEEPPAHVKFIFATTEPHKVPVTILSRCQRFDFKRIPPIQIIKHLVNITKKEGIKISKSSLALIARQAEGSMRDAESLLDQVTSYAGTKVGDDQVTEILGIIDRHIILEVSRAIIEGSPKTCMEIFSRIYDYGYDIKEFYRALMDHFRNLMINLIDPENHLLDMSESDKEEIRRQAEMAGFEKLQVLLNFLINREEDVRFTSHPRLILEATMIKLCHLDDFLSFDELIKKVESLEKRITSMPDVKEQPLIDHMSDPAATWISHASKKPRKEKETDVGESRTWDDFLRFLSSKNRAMFSMLKDWELIELTDKTVEISKDKRSFSSTYFDDKDRYNLLSGYCREFFQREIRVIIVDNNQTLPKENISSERSNSEPLKQTDLSQPVQDILNMFEGEIREEYPAKKVRKIVPKEAMGNEEVQE